VRAALVRCRVAQTAPRREGFAVFDARKVAKELAAQTGGDWTEMLFELRRWAATVGGTVRPRAAAQPPTAPRPLFLYLPNAVVAGGS